MCVFTCRAADAQQVAMRIFNGSFEEWEVNNKITFLHSKMLDFYTPFYEDTLYYWFSRSHVVLVQDGKCTNSDQGNWAVDTTIKPVEGNYYIGFPEGKAYTHDVYRVGNVSQLLPCFLHKGVKYKVSFYATTDSITVREHISDSSSGLCHYDTIHVNAPPTVSLILGTIDLVYDFRDWTNLQQQSNYQFILNQFPLSKKIWRKFEVDFIPIEDYDLLSVAAIHDPCQPCVSGTSTFGWSTLILDAVSDIYYAEPTFVLPPNDSLTAGECYQVSPYNIHPNEAEHRWEVLGSDSIFYMGAEPELCPTQTTTYVVYSHDECGWAEIDTLTLVVLPKKEEPPVPVQPESSLVLYPNPGSASGQVKIRSSHAGIFRLFDASGRLIGQYSLQAGEQTLQAQLASGIYFYQATLSDQSRKRGKYLVGRK